MADISDWSGTASNNSVASPDGAATGWVGADVGPWARETMAAIQRWYKDPSWVNPTNDISPAGLKTITRLNDKSVRISAASNFSTAELTHFPKGRLIRLILTGGSTKIFCIVDTATLNNGDIDLVVALLGQNIIPSGTTFASNGLEFYGPQESITTANDWQPLGATAWSGAGTTSERNARFGTATFSELPAGILWFNTSTNFIEALGPDHDNPGSQRWHNIAPFDAKWSSDGASLRVEATTETNNSNARLDLITQDGGSVAVVGLSRRKQNDPTGTESLGFLQGSSSYLIVHAPGILNAGDVGGRLVMYTGDPAASSLSGNIYWQQGTGVDDGNGNVTTQYAFKNMTPGLVDAGTLNLLDSDTIISRAVNIDNWHWRMSGAAHPAGDGTTTASFVQLQGNGGNRVELARFAFPEALIDELGIGNTYDLRFEFALSGFSGANGNTNPANQSYTNAADQIQISAYAGSNYGDPAQSISGFPSTGGTQFNRYTNEAGNGLADWSLNNADTSIRVTITANTGIALAAQTSGPSNTFYVRINASVPALNSIPAMLTRVSFTPVKGTRYVAGDFQSDAQ